MERSMAKKANPITEECLNRTPTKRGSVVDRLFAKTKVNPKTGCLEFTGYRDKKGYGRIQVAGSGRCTHRVSWQAHNGPIPESIDGKDACVLHKCDNPPCINPDHLFLGSNDDNMADMIKKGRGADTRGVKNGRAKLNEFQVRVIKRLFNHKSMTQKEAGDIFGVSVSSIAKVKSGLCWGHM